MSPDSHATFKKPLPRFPKSQKLINQNSKSLLNNFNDNYNDP